jgi:hypothetical protein
MASFFIVPLKKCFFFEKNIKMSSTLEISFLHSKTMKKYILLLLLVNLLSPFYITYGQDVIVKKNGEEVKGKVVLVGKKNIQYKNFEDPEFSNQTIDIEKVKKIRFEDGTEKIFDHYLRHYIGISVGGSDALGDFASDNYNNSKAGYAYSGSQYYLDGGLYLVKNFGITMTAGAFRNPMNFGRLKDPFNNQNLNVDVSYPGGGDNKYLGGYIMAGPLYSLKIGKVLAIDTKVLTGIFSLKTPEYALMYNDYQNKRYTFNYGIGKGATLGVMGGLALRFHITRFLGIRIASEFVTATPKTKNHVTKTIQSPGPTSQTVTEEQNITYHKVSIMKMSVGLVYLIKRK